MKGERPQTDHQEHLEAGVDFKKEEVTKVSNIEAEEVEVLTNRHQKEVSFKYKEALEGAVTKNLEEVIQNLEEAIKREVVIKNPEEVTEVNLTTREISKMITIEVTGMRKDSMYQERRIRTRNQT